MLITSFSLFPCTNFLWWLNLETLTQAMGQTLLDFQILLVLVLKISSHIRFSLLAVLTEVRIDSSVFSQGITHGDTLKGSD